ncbi:hypothetical protein EV701_107280 [Chthoniobacter flavus]|nr:hypothetical protein EV701_107280 [Chthoniobacter flavus]
MRCQTAQRLASRRDENAVRLLNAKRHSNSPEAHSAEPYGTWRQSRMRCQTAQRGGKRYSLAHALVLIDNAL